MARVLIGTSGWSYSSWRGPFFPTGLPAKHQLEYYASQFDTVELNGVFYRTPTPEFWSGVGVIVNFGAPLRLRLEGVEVHQPLETLVRELDQQPATPR